MKGTPVNKPSDEALTWEYDVPILTNPFLLWDVVRVFVISAAIIEGIVWLMAFLFTDDPLWLPPQIWLVALGVIVGLFVLIGLMFANRFSMRFAVNAKGASGMVSRREGKRRVYRFLKWLGVVLFFFSGQMIGTPSPQGGESIPWREVHKVTVHRRLRVISLRDSWHVVLRLYCPKELFEEIAARVQEYASQAAARRAKRAKPRRWRPLWFYPAWTVGTILATFACAAWPWTTYDHVERIALVAGALVLIVGLTSSFWWSKLLSFAAIAASLWFLMRLALAAIEPFHSRFGGAPSYTYMLDTPLLIVAALGGLALLTLAAARLIMPELDT